MASFTLNVPYGKVVGRFGVAIGDGIDSDAYPDTTPPTGTVTFTPTVPKVLVATGLPDPITLELQPITATLDSSGYLTFNGQQGVWLVATDSTVTNPYGWTYTVQYNIVYSGGVIDKSKFDIAVPAAQLNTASTWTDLTKAAPVPTSTGNGVTKGDPGPVTDLQIGTVTSGPTAAATITGNAPTKTLNLVLPTSGGGGAGTVTQVNGILPDGAGNVVVSKAALGLGNVDNTADANKVFTASQISDATTLSRQIIQAATAAAIRTLIGAGTSSVAIGTTAGTAADASTVALASQLASYALLANPTFTGNVGVPTRTAGDNNAYAASTAFVQTAIAGLTSATPNTGSVGYNSSTHTWPSRPSIPNGPVEWRSTNDPSAIQPPGMLVGDSWVQHPDAV